MRIVCLVSIGGLAVLWDFYSRRIPNQLTGTGFLAALAWQWSANGPPGIFDFFAGAITPVIVYGDRRISGSETKSEVYLRFISDCCYDFSGSDYQISYLKKTSISIDSLCKRIY